MKKIDMLVKAPFFYTMEGEGVGFKENVVMAVDGGKIIDFIDADKASEVYSAEEVLDLSHHAVMPGFIDAHMHTSDNLFRGLSQDTNNWMMYGLQPFENAGEIEEKLSAGRLGIIEAIKAGTTTLGDYHYSMDNVCQFIDRKSVV